MLKRLRYQNRFALLLILVIFSACDANKNNFPVYPTNPENWVPPGFGELKGYVWIAETDGPDRILKIDVKTGEEVLNIELPGDEHLSQFYVDRYHGIVFCQVTRDGTDFLIKYSNEGDKLKEIPFEPTVTEYCEYGGVLYAYQYPTERRYSGKDLSYVDTVAILEGGRSFSTDFEYGSIYIANINQLEKYTFTQKKVFESESVYPDKILQISPDVISGACWVYAAGAGEGSEGPYYWTSIVRFDCLGRVTRYEVLRDNFNSFAVHRPTGVCFVGYDTYFEIFAIHEVDDDDWPEWVDYGADSICFDTQGGVAIISEREYVHVIHIGSWAELWRKEAGLRRSFTVRYSLK